MPKGLCRCAPLILAALVVLALVGGCANGRHFSDLRESLSIQLMPNTSKLFVYQLEAPDGLRRQLVQVYRSPRDVRDHRPLEPLDERAYRQLRANAERAVSATEYCRDGFMELDFRLSRDEMWLRGECREGASKKDQERFANRSELPIPQPE